LARLALPLCLAFILFALRQDIKECRQISHSIWIPFTWLALAASRPLSLWIYPSLGSAEITGLDYIQGNPMERTFSGILLCVGIMVLYKRRNRFAYYFRDNIYLSLFYIYAFISIGWSDYQGASIRRWIRTTGDAIMVLLILTENDQKEAIDHILRRCAILLIPLSIVFIRYYSHIGISYSRDAGRMWIGVTTSKNSLGMLCGFIGIFLVWRLLRGWPQYKVMILDGFLLFLTLYLLRGSGSATSYVIFVIGIIILVLGTYLKGNIRKFNTLVVVTFLLLLILQGILISVFDESIPSLFFSAMARDPSFTGRAPLWLKLIKIGSQRPILGAGYGSVWIRDSSLTRAIFNESIQFNAHNGYIHVFMDLGLIGLSLIFLLIAQTYKKIINSFDKSWETGILLLAFMLMIVFHNITEATITRGQNFLWFLFLLSSIIVVKKTGAQDAHSELRG